MLPDIVLYLYLITVIVVGEIFALTTKNYNAFDKNLNYSSYTKVEQVTKGLNIFDAKHYDEGAAENSGEIETEKPPDNILNEILEYSDVISVNLQDYSETPVDLHSDTESRNPVISSIGPNMAAYNKNVSKLMSIEKSKAKENDYDTSETDSVEAVDEGSGNTKTVTSTENYENEIMKSLLPSLNLSVKLNESKKNLMENMDILPTKQTLKKVNISVNNGFSSIQAAAQIMRPKTTQILNNDVIKINELKIVGNPKNEEINISQKDAIFEHYSKTTSKKRLIFSVTPTTDPTYSDYAMKPINKSRIIAKQKTPLIKSQNVKDTGNWSTTHISNKVNKMHFDNAQKVGHETFSNKTISKNIKTLFTPSSLAKNNTMVLKVLSNIVKQLNNILSSSSESVSKTDDKVTNEFKTYQFSPKKKSDFSSKSTKYDTSKMNKPFQKHEIENTVKQKNVMQSREQSKIRDNLKKKTKSKQKWTKSKVNKSVKTNNTLYSKIESSADKNFTAQGRKKDSKKIKNITIPQELKVSKPFTDEEEIKTQNEKDLGRALQIFDTYANKLNSNKINGIFDDKSKSDDNDESPIEVYEDYVKRLDSKKFEVNMTENMEEMENNRHDKKSSKVIEKCGVTNSNFTIDEDQTWTSIENFQWLGVLCYRESRSMRRFTNVILVTRNMVIASAVDVYKIPKAYFRQRSKVVLGHPCNYRPGLRVLGYRYHPEYGKGTYSSIALIQLDVTVDTVLYPLCANPTKLIKPQFYAFVLPDMCKQTSIKIYRMTQLDFNLCRSYYDGTGLNTASVWPKHALCGIALHRSGCLWRNGVALVVKKERRWYLMGFGVNGPGCGAPSRFVDYSVYSGWVAGSAARVGRPALTTLADNHLILRRSMRVLQRHGACDPFEKQSVLYTNHYETTKFDDQDSIKKSGVFRYNITLHPSYDYTCIDMRASSTFKVPLIILRRYHTNQTDYSQFDFIHYSLKVYFAKALDINITAYGKKHQRSN